MSVVSRMVVVALSVGLAGCSAAQRPAAPPHSGPAFLAAFGDAIRALNRKQYAEALAPLRAADQLDPGNDMVVYLIAVAAARAHDRQAVLDALERLDALGSDAVPAPGDLAEFDEDRQLQAVVQRLAERAAAESRAVMEGFRIAEPGLVPEGIAYDARTGAFFVGSIQRHKIVRVRGGASEDFVPGAAGLPVVLGLRVDAERRLLWAACEPGEVDPAAAPGSGAVAELSVFDADTGARKGRYPAPADGKHLLNDVALGDDGAVFVTDSAAGQVWAVWPGASALAAVVPAGRFVYPNGIAWDAARRSLLVADELTIWRLDPRTGEALPLGAPGGVSLAGLDGMYLERGWIIGVQGPARVVAFALAADHARVTERRVLAAIHPAFDGPTTGAVAPDGFYLIANSQIRSTRPPSPTIVLRMPLPW